MNILKIAKEIETNKLVLPKFKDAGEQKSPIYTEYKGVNKHKVVKEWKSQYKYASELLNNKPLPKGYIDKTICGCGFTTVAIENSENTVIAVPYLNLVNNKVEQYKDKEGYKYSILAVKQGVTDKDIEEYIKNAEVVKIMATYDSLGKLEKYLPFMDSLVIDEAQELTNLIDFKSQTAESGEDVITRVYRIAYQNKEKVSFITATPIPLEYEPSWLSELTYHKFTWGETLKARPILMQSLNPTATLLRNIIAPIKRDGFSTISTVNGKIIRYKKAIIFVNHVSTIASICKKAGLSSSEVGFIAGNNPENDIKLKKYSRIVNPKKLPKFTFITSTGYSGIDLYDDEALTIVMSNFGNSYTMVDMLTDLKQAVSRQRSENNPHREHYLFLYNVNPFGTSESEFDSVLENSRRLIEKTLLVSNMILKMETDGEGEKILKEEIVIETYNMAMRDEIRRIYITPKLTKGKYRLVFNERLFMANMYRVKETYRQYQKGFDLNTVVVDKGEKADIVNSSSKVKKNMNYVELVRAYKSLKTEKERKDLLDVQRSVNNNLVLLIEKQLELKVGLTANYTRAKAKVGELEKTAKETKQCIVKDLARIVEVGTYYSLESLQGIFGMLYDKYGIASKPKANYIQNFYKVKRKVMKGINGYMIVEKK